MNEWDVHRLLPVLPAGAMLLSESKLYRLTASEVSTLLKSGDLTVVEYARSLLEHIDAREPIVKAWAYLDKDLILDEARKLDQLLPEERGVLHGIPIGIKDVIYTKGINSMPQMQLIN